MFAGPNGSGKSCLKAHLEDHWIKLFINADEIELELLEGLSLSEKYDISEDDGSIINALKHRIEGVNGRSRGLKLSVENLKVENGIIRISQRDNNSYFASAIAAYVRETLLNQKRSFSFETVMSHESKVEFLKLAQEKGYRTYLYYICTSYQCLYLFGLIARLVICQENEQH